MSGALLTAADAPESVVKLLKSYDPKGLRWQRRDHRHLIVVAILTRGNEEAREWLWSVLSKVKVRELVRLYRGAGCAEPDRAALREQLELTTSDSPTRPYSAWSVAMKEEVLDPEKKRIVALQGVVVHDERFLLAGGTGLGLRLGHGISRDLDWFTARPFDPERCSVSHRTPRRSQVH
jgi:hypothetical protein